MSEEFNKLIKRFEKAIQDKEEGTFDKSDVQDIYDAAHEFFKDDRSVSDQELTKIRDKWVELASGHIDRSRAMKKLQGTSRAEAIQSVLNNLVP